MSYFFTATNTAPNTVADVSLTGGSAAKLVATTPGVLAKQKIVVQAIAANTDKVRVGDSTILTTRGIELAPGDSVAFDGIQDPSKIYGIVYSGTQKVAICWW